MNALARHAPRSRAPLFALLGANVVSMSGNVTAMIAIPWFVLATTGSASKTGMAGFVVALPMVLTGVFGGALVDRLGFKRMGIVADIASGVAVALVPLLHLTIGLEFWQLLALIFMGALLDAPGMSARNSMLPELARMAGIGLERANAAEQSISRFSIMFGAPVAGLLIGVIGVTHVLWINAASFLISAAALALFVPNIVVPRRDDAVTPARSYVAELREGFSFIRHDGLVLTLVSMVALLNFLDAMITVILPVFAERVYGSAFSLGVMFAASGAGALVTLFLFGMIGHRLPRREVFIGGFVVAALPLFVFLATPALWIVAVAGVVRGFGAGPLNPVYMTTMQERVPIEVRGRVFGLAIATAWLGMPIGRLLAGFSIEWIGLIPTFAVVAVVYLSATLSMLSIRALNDMNRTMITTIPIQSNLATHGKGAHS